MCSLAESGLYDKFVTARNNGMNPYVVVPRGCLEIDCERQRSVAGAVHGTLEMIDLLNPASTDIRLDSPGVVAESDGGGVRSQLVARHSGLRRLEMSPHGGVVDGSEEGLPAIHQNKTATAVITGEVEV